MVPTYEQEEDFILNLGRALVKWQSVEGAAFGLFRSFMRGTNDHLISVAFHHIQSFSSAVALLDRCAYFVLPDGSLQTRWRGDKSKKNISAGLKSRLDNQIAIRNRLVHFRYHTGMTNGEPIVTLGPSFFDATYAINDKWKNPNFTIDIAGLKSAQKNFRVLEKDIIQFQADFESTIAE